MPQLSSPHWLQQVRELARDRALFQASNPVTARSPPKPQSAPSPDAANSKRLRHPPRVSVDGPAPAAHAEAATNRTHKSSSSNSSDSKGSDGASDEDLTFSAAAARIDELLLDFHKQVSVVTPVVVHVCDLLTLWATPHQVQQFAGRTSADSPDENRSKVGLTRCRLTDPAKHTNTQAVSAHPGAARWLVAAQAR